MLLVGLQFAQAEEIPESSSAAPSEQLSQPPSAEEPKAEEAQQNPFAAFWHWTTEDPVAAYTAMLTLFTGVLASGTFLLVKDGRAHSRHSLRAYIGAQQITVIHGVSGVGAVPRFGMNIVNNGQTPAYAVRAWQEIRCYPHPLTGPIQDAAFDGHSRVLNPREFFGAIVTADNPITQAEWTSINDGTMRLYLYGRIEFRDAFGKNRWATHRTFFNVQENMMAAAPEGNEAN